MESGIFLLLLILLQGMAKTEAFADEEDYPFSLSAYFTAKANKRLKGYAVKRFESPSLLSCSHACMRTEWCSSTNFKLSSKNDIKGTCELNKYALIDENAVFDEEEGNTFSLILKHPCQYNPCQNNGECVPDDLSRNTYHCVCKPGFTGTHCKVSKGCKFDFEHGIADWVKTGTVFNNQPTYGDNPTARNREPANQQGDWWIGGAEDRPSKATTAGEGQWDGPQGTLTSPFFTITGKNISFLIGGGCDITTVRAELIIRHGAVRQTTGKCNETMTRKFWDVGAYFGQRARVKLVDFSSGVWGHINFDDLKGDISC